MVMIIDQAVKNGNAIDPQEVRQRFQSIRRKLKFITDRITAS